MNSSVKELPFGATVYTKSSLLFYDVIVHSISDRWIWKCPQANVAELYSQSLSENHLEIGIGSGRFFRRATNQRSFRRLMIADVNDDCLSVASRVLRTQPHQSTRLNLLKEFESRNDLSGFDSVGLNYVLHCLPLEFSEKLRLLDRLMQHCLTKNGVMVGSTILPDCQRSWISSRLMSFYNRKKIFSNHSDSLEQLQDWVASKNRRSNLKTIGAVALFQVYNEP